MWLVARLTALAVLACWHGLAAETPAYLVLAPQVFRAGMTYNVSVTSFRAGTPQAALTIVDNSTGQSVATVTSPPLTQGVPSLVSLQIPSDATRSKFSLKVQMDSIKNSSSVNMHQKTMSVFIQTDKAMYKPGQLVNYRVFAVKPDLLPYMGPINIDVFDPKGNKIRQYVDQRNDSAMGVLTKSLQLTSLPVLGDWKIKVNAGGQKVEKVFTVAEYVLPLYEVKVTLPPYGLTRTQEKIIGQVEAKYTYGKGVKGKVTLKAMFVPLYQYSRSPSVKSIMKKMDINGTASFEITHSEIRQTFGLAGGAIPTNQNFVVIANVTETLTGTSQSGNESIRFYDEEHEVEFLEASPSHFKPGLKYTAFAKVTQPDGTPPAPRTTPLQVEVKYHSEWNDPDKELIRQTLDVPADGLLPVTVDIPTRATTFTLTVSLKGSSTARAVKSPNPFETRSGQQMQITLKDVDSVSQAGGDIVFQLRSTSSLSKVSYQIVSRGTIHSVGEQVFASAATRQEFTITADSNMAPKARILVYFLTADGEMIVDSVDFTVEGAFRNDVSVRFTNPSNTEITQSELGKDVTFEVTAAAGSFVGCLAVDQSVLLLKSGNDITQAEVLAELEEYDVKDTSGGFNPCLRGEPCIMAKRKKRSFWWPYPIGGNNAFDLLKEAGMLVMTDAYLKKDLVLYPMTDNWLRRADGGDNVFEMAALLPVADNVAEADQSRSSNSLQTVEEVRKEFPETWLWIDKIAGSDGRVSFETKVPDTITSWVASAFAVSDTMGLGVGPTPAKLRAFKPFFVTVNLPYSVVRGEQLELKAIVFNYMGVDQTVTVTLKRSTAFKVQGKEESTNKIDSGLAFAEVKNVIKVPAGGGTSTSFWIVPQDLGGVKVEVHAQSTSAADGMEKMLLVKPEGKLQEVAQSFLVNVTSSTPFQQTLQLPIANASTLVPGSEYITVSAIGDIMGSTLDGLERLVRQPTGCGEQNMLGLVPNIVVRKYLEGVDRLSNDIRAKTTKFMKLGYERELNYQHDDGSFSAFGNSDNSGSMWLTAFVLKSFHQLKMLNDPEVFIDPAIINNAVSWILKKQSRDGSFPEPGNVIHKDMQGKAGSGTSLTAYVASALAEAQASLSSSDSARNLADAMRFLETELSSITDPYILSIMAYSFIKAGKQSLADQTLAKLEPMATEKDGMKFWEDQSDPMPVSGSHFYHHQAKSSSIEMTSYVLLTYLAKRDLITGVPMMKWLTSQRNGHGGFRSTQDTVMGLTALAEFAALSGNTSKNLQITVTTDQNIASSFTPITDQNDLVLQKIQLEKSTREVTIRVTGTGVGLIQVSSIFNVKAGGYKKANYIKTFPETRDSGSSSENNGIALRVNVQESADKNSMEAQVCGRWTGVDRSGMVTLEYGVVSGYAADADQLRKQDGIKKVETEDQKLVAYFDELPTDEKCWMVKAQRVAAVTNVQEAPITLSAYYQNDVETTVFYQPQAQKTMCEVCPECVGCTNTAGQGGGNKTSGSSAATYGIVTIVLATLTAIMF